MTDRRQRVVVEGGGGGGGGALQGSVLRPFFFNIPNDIKRSTILKYEDDTKLFRKT